MESADKTREWARRHVPNGEVGVLVGKIPVATFKDLLATGKIVIEDVAVGLPQIVFSPGSFATFNSAVKWIKIIEH